VGISRSFLYCFVKEIKQRFRSRIVGLAEVRVDLVVGGLSGAEHCNWNARVFQRVTQSLRLRARIRVLGDMQDKERRNVFVLGHVRDRGEVLMLRGVVAELLTVTKLRLRQTMHPTPGFRCLDDGRDIKGIPIHGHAAFDAGEGPALGLQIAIVAADERREVSPDGMPHDEKALRIASMLRDVIMYPVDRLGYVAEYRRDVNAWQKPVVGRDKDEPFVREHLRLDLNARFVARLPTAAVNPED